MPAPHTIQSPPRFLKLRRPCSPSSKQQSLPFPIIFLTLNVFHNAIAYPPGAEHQAASGWPRSLRLRLLALQWQLEYIKAMRLNGLPKVIDTNYVLQTVKLCCDTRNKVLVQSGLADYRIVASRNTCYYSGSRKFCFLKSRLLSCRIIFFRNKTFLFFKIES